MNNLELLNNERLKPFMVKYHNGLRDTIVEVNSSHPWYTRINIFIESNSFENSYTFDQIEDGHLRNQDGSIRALNKNLNYAFNRSTYLFRVTEKLAKIVDAVEEKRSFGH